MGERLDAVAGLQGGEERLHVDARRVEQRLAERLLPGAKGAGASQARPDASTMRRTSEKPFEWTPEEGRPISTSPAATSLRQQRAALGRADREAGEIVIAPCVKARHFGRLAADQRAAGLHAAFGDALDDGDADLRA